MYVEELTRAANFSLDEQAKMMSDVSGKSSSVEPYLLYSLTLI